MNYDTFFGNRRRSLLTFALTTVLISLSVILSERIGSPGVLLKTEETGGRWGVLNSKVRKYDTNRDKVADLWIEDVGPWDQEQPSGVFAQVHLKSRKQDRNYDGKVDLEETWEYVDREKARISMREDSDFDGFFDHSKTTDYVEGLYSEVWEEDRDGDGIADHVLSDTDSDGTADLQKWFYRIAYANSTLDGDGFNYYEEDEDMDGQPDIFTVRLGSQNLTELERSLLSQYKHRP